MASRQAKSKFLNKAVSQHMSDLAEILQPSSSKVDDFVIFDQSSTSSIRSTEYLTTANMMDSTEEYLCAVDSCDAEGTSTHDCSLSDQEYFIDKEFDDVDDLSNQIDELSAPMSSLSDEENNEDLFESGNLEEDLATWAVEHNISHKAINALLKCLSKFHKLPTDARTLLHTLLHYYIHYTYIHYYIISIIVLASVINRLELSSWHSLHITLISLQ